MSFPLTPGTLAAGQVGDAIHDLFVATAPVARVQVVLGNTDTNTQWVGVAVKRSGGSDRFVRGANLEAKDPSGYVGGVLALELGALSEGDAVRAVAETAGEIDYTIIGVS